MGWVNSPDLFCATSETVADLANVAFHSDLPLTRTYSPTATLYHCAPSPTAGPDRLQYVDVYMDDLNCLSQGDSLQQQRLTEIVLSKLKMI